MRTKIKDTYILQSKIAKITGYENVLHTSKVAKVKDKKLKINLQITVTRCRIQLFTLTEALNLKFRIISDKIELDWGKDTNRLH